MKKKTPQTGDMTNVDVATHIRSLLFRWLEYDELTTTREDGVLRTKRRNGQRFKIIVKELPRGRPISE